MKSPLPFTILSASSSRTTALGSGSKCSAARVLEQLHEQLARQRALINLEPKRAFCVDGRSRADALPLARSIDQRSLPTLALSLRGRPVAFVAFKARRPLPRPLAIARHLKAHERCRPNDAATSAGRSPSFIRRTASLRISSSVSCPRVLPSFATQHQAMNGIIDGVGGLVDGLVGDLHPSQTSLHIGQHQPDEVRRKPARGPGNESCVIEWRWATSIEGNVTVNQRRNL